MITFYKAENFGGGNAFRIYQDVANENFEYAPRPPTCAGFRREVYCKLTDQALCLLKSLVVVGKTQSLSLSDHSNWVQNDKYYVYYYGTFL